MARSDEQILISRLSPLQTFRKSEEGKTNKKPNILLVEDALVSSMIIKKQLERSRYTVVTANSGENAIEEYKKYNSTIHIILMDINMPKMDGLETTMRIRYYFKQQMIDYPLLIYALTADGEQKNYDKYIESGMDGYFTKDQFDTSILIIAIQMSRDKHKFITKELISEKFNPTLLIVDDMKVSLKIVTNSLRNTDYVLEGVTSGIDAINKYKQHYKSLEIILMDINMPEVSGVDATIQIRELEKELIGEKKVLILGLTGNIDQSNLDVYRKSGFDGCISKGSNIEKCIQEAVEYVKENPGYEFIDLTK